MSVPNKKPVAKASDSEGTLSFLTGGGKAKKKTEAAGDPVDGGSPESKSGQGKASSKGLKSIVNGGKSKVDLMAYLNEHYGSGTATPEKKVAYKPIMESDDRVEALNFGARTYKSGGKFIRVPNFFSEKKIQVQNGQLVYKPSAPQMRPARVEGEPTRAAGPKVKPKVPQPGISYSDMTRSVRFSR